MMLTSLISMWLVLVLKRLSSWLLKCPKSQCETTIRIQLDNMRRVRASRVLPIPWSSLWRTRSSGRVSFLSRACRSSRGIVFWSILKTNLTWSKRKSSMTGGQSSQTRKWPPPISLPSILAPLRSSMTSRSKRRSSRTALTRSCPRTALLGIRTTKSIKGTAQCSLDPQSLKDWAKWVCLSLSPLKETVCLLPAISDLREGPTLWCSRWTLSRLHRVSAKELSMMKRWSITKSKDLQLTKHLLRWWMATFFLAKVSRLCKKKQASRGSKFHLNMMEHLMVITKVDSGTPIGWKRRSKK